MNRSDDLFLSEDFEKLLRESLPDYAADSLLHTLSSGEPAEKQLYCGKRWKKNLYL